MRSRITAGAAALLLGWNTALCAASPAPTVPAPDLSGLEPAVQQQLAEARATVTAALAREAMAPHDLVSHFAELGRLYLAYGLLDAADAAFAGAEASGGPDYRLVYYRAYAAERDHRLPDAEAGYRATLERQPAFLPARMRLAQLLRRAGRLEEAQAELRAATTAMAAEVPGLGVLLAEWGELRLEQDRAAEALTFLEPVLAAFPQADRLHYPTAMALRTLGRADQAREHLAQQGTIGLRFPDELIDGLAELTRGERVQLLRAQTAYRAGDYGAAVDAFRAALKANPRSTPGHVGLGAALDAMGDTAGALAAQRRALALEPGSSAARFNLAELLLKQGDAAGAAEQLEELLVLKPNDVQARSRLADVHLALGRPEAAADQLHAILERRPGDVRLRLQLARLLLDQGAFAEAKAQLERARETDPGDGHALHALTRLLAASPDPTLRDGPAALELAQQVFAARNSGAHAETLAMALAQSGRCAEAVKVQQAVLEAIGAGRAAGDEAAAAARLRHYRDDRPCAPPLGDVNRPHVD